MEIQLSASATDVRVEPQAGALGAYIHGVDINTLSAAESRELIYGALNRHQVLCVRSQAMTPDQHLRFSSSFGDVYRQPVVQGKVDYPDIVEVRGTVPLTESWHSDSTHSKRPPALTILMARVLPDYGNDTMFANQHAAYWTLSPAMRAMLDPLKALHRTSTANSALYVGTGVVEESLHPVVRTHPRTGEKALFVNRQYTKHFDGMTEGESRPLLEFLYEHGARPEFTWRHRWRPGDLLVWDNASVQHCVVGDRPGKSDRLLDRVTVLGEEPF